MFNFFAFQCGLCVLKFITFSDPTVLITLSLLDKVVDRRGLYVVGTIPESSASIELLSLNSFSVVCSNYMYIYNLFIYSSANQKGCNLKLGAL